MGFKDLFKVRKPGNGGSVEKAFASASKKSQSRSFPSKDNSANSSGKKGV